MRIAVLGLGEAGSVFAGGLADRGAHVTGYDPAVADAPTGVTRADSAVAAVADAEIVLSAVGGGAAAAVAAQVLPHMAPATVFADLNTASPQLKRELAEQARSLGVRFADVAVMAPVQRSTVETPCLVSGTGAADLLLLGHTFSLSMTVAGDDAGAAAGLKLLRSVFMKGLAALVFESMEAAGASGAADWMRTQIVGEFDGPADALVERLIEGTRTHAARREREMLDARDHLEALGSPTWVTDATVQWMHLLAAPGPDDADPAPADERTSDRPVHAG